jgi:ribulose-phosphate 3-epimerase
MTSRLSAIKRFVSLWSVKASVSLWSADLLALGEAIDALDGRVDGFHMDVMDGRLVPELLFGPDAVRAVSARARSALVDVHLIVADADAWIEPFAEAGAGMLTVHPQSSPDVEATLRRIEALGVRPAVALTLDLPVDAARPWLELADRVLVMGTPIGIKGVGLDPSAPGRIRRLAQLRDASARKPEIYADGGIRDSTVPELARAGADGVVPGSLVFGRPDRLEGVRFIHAQAGAS